MKNTPAQQNAMLLLVTGLPGTGKTSFAMALAQALGARHLNSDKIRENLHLRGQYDDASKKKVYDALFQQTAEALAAGQSALVDATFYKKTLRQPYMDLAKNAESRFFVIELQADEKVVKERVSKQRPLSEADFEVYQNIKKQYEPIEQPHCLLRSDTSDINEMVQQALLWLATANSA